MKSQSLPSSFLLGIAALSAMALSGGLNFQAIAQGDRHFGGGQACTPPDSTGSCPPGVTCCPQPSPK